MKKLVKFEDAQLTKIENEHISVFEEVEDVLIDVDTKLPIIGYVGYNENYQGGKLICIDAQEKDCIDAINLLYKHIRQLKKKINKN